MAYERKPGDFTLAKNADKKKEGADPKWADYKGSGLDLDGNEVWVNGWIKTGEHGTFLACNMRPKTGKKPAEKAPAKKSADPGGFDDMESDIPFSDPYRHMWRMI